MLATVCTRSRCQEYALNHHVGLAALCRTATQVGQCSPYPKNNVLSPPLARTNAAWHAACAAKHNHSPRVDGMLCRLAGCACVFRLHTADTRALHLLGDSPADLAELAQIISSSAKAAWDSRNQIQRQNRSKNKEMWSKRPERTIWGGCSNQPNTLQRAPRTHPLVAGWNRARPSPAIGTLSWSGARGLLRFHRQHGKRAESVQSNIRRNFSKISSACSTSNIRRDEVHAAQSCSKRAEAWSMSTNNLVDNGQACAHIAQTPATIGRSGSNSANVSPNSPRCNRHRQHPPQMDPIQTIGPSWSASLRFGCKQAEMCNRRTPSQTARNNLHRPSAFRPASLGIEQIWAASAQPWPGTLTGPVSLPGGQALCLHLGALSPKPLSERGLNRPPSAASARVCPRWSKIGQPENRPRIHT